MADKDKEGAEATEGEAAGGGKKKVILLAVMALVLIGISVGGTIFALKMFGGEEEVAAEEEAPIEEVKKAAIYYPMKPPIIVNFQARGRQRFLQAELTLMLRDESMIGPIETHMPMLRNSMVMLFGGQVYEELQTPEGKDLLQEQALTEVQDLLEQETGNTVVEQVLFTSFVMQ
ncbi:MAG: flagellar basal body-associated FliL family protein [Cellvibrionaceae bacterium]